MKVRAILEFDLEDEFGEPVEYADVYRQATHDTEHAIRSQLIGNGFLADDLVIGSWTLAVDVIDEAMSNTDPPS